MYDFSAVVVRGRIMQSCDWNQNRRKLFNWTFESETTETFQTHLKNHEIIPNSKGWLAFEQMTHQSY